MFPVTMTREIRRLTLKARHDLDTWLVGGKASVFRGRGMTFEEVRAYQPGDDVRTIDWNVTARMGEPFVKVFREERQLDVMLLFDASASCNLSTAGRSKRQAALEMAAAVSVLALANQDRLGLLTCTESVERHVPLGRGRAHVFRILAQLLEDKPAGRGTNLEAGLTTLVKTAKRRALSFVFSDFLDEGFERAFLLAAKRHEVIPVVLSDVREREWEKAGLVPMRDPETGTVVWAKVTARDLTKYRALAADRRERLKEFFARQGTRPLWLGNDDPVVARLAAYLSERG